MPDGDEFNELRARIVELTAEVRRLEAITAHQGDHGLGFSEEQYDMYTAVRNWLAGQGISTEQFRAFLNVLNLITHDEGGLIRYVRPC
ncbi:MAG TPA: hypothetical protein VF486_06545 [Actinomycetes bacterium]